MGILKRLSEKSQQKVWAGAGLGPLDEPINYAHLRSRSATDFPRGTLFLTNQRLIWRIADPGFPPGSGFSLPLWNVVSVQPVKDVPEQCVFRMAAPESSGEVVSLDFYPGRQGRASRMLARQFYVSLLAELERIAQLREADEASDY